MSHQHGLTIPITSQLSIAHPTKKINVAYVFLTRNLIEPHNFVMTRYRAIVYPQFNSGLW